VLRGAVPCHSGSGSGRVVHDQGEAEIRNQGVVILIEEDVGGFDVPVGDFLLRALVVQVAERFRHAECDLQARRPIQRRSTWPSVSCQCDDEISCTRRSRARVEVGAMSYREGASGGCRWARSRRRAASPPWRSSRRATAAH
jgi:hypothetical protein